MRNYYMTSGRTNSPRVELNQSDINQLYNLVDEAFTKIPEYVKRTHSARWIDGMVFTHLRQAVASKERLTWVCNGRRKYWPNGLNDTDRELIERLLASAKERHMKIDEMTPLRTTISEMDACLKRMDNINQQSNAVIDRLADISKTLDRGEEDAEHRETEQASGV